MKQCMMALMLTALSSGTFAQETVAVDRLEAPKHEAKMLSLIDAVNAGLNNNYSIVLARKNEQMSDNNASVGNAGMLPSLTLNGSLSKGIADSHMTFIDNARPAQDRSGAESTNMNANVALEWTVFDGLAMFARYDRLQVLKAVGQENLRSSIQQTVASIISEYYNIVALQRQMIATENILRISRQRLHSAGDLFTAGKVSKVDLLSAQVDYNADTASYIQQTAQLRDAKIKLNRLLAREINQDFTAADSIVIDQGLNFGKILDKALSGNPNMVLAQLKLNEATFALKEAKGARYPTVKLSSTYTMTNNTASTGQVEQNKSNAWNFGATASMPLFNGFNINREIKNARIEKESAEVTLADMRKEIETQVATAFSAYEVNRKLAIFETDNLGLAAENLDVSMERYRYGAISAIELRDVQSSYISAINRMIVALYNAKVAETSLKLLTGEVLRMPEAAK